MSVRNFIRILVGAALACTLAAQPERPIKPGKKTKEPVTQALPLLPDPPAAAVAETAKLVFHVSPLSNKGLLSQQIRDALKALDRDNHGAQVVKLRAFVAGTGDMRRVQQIASEMFTEKKQPLPAITTVQVGALPLTGAQVVIESTAMDKRAVNSGGVAFLPPQTLDALKNGGDILQLTCFMPSLDNLPSFPGVAVDFVQLTRATGSGPPLCEAVTRTPGGAAKVVFSGLQLAFRDQPEDVRSAMERLKKAIEPLGGKMEGAVATTYSFAPGTGRLVVEGLPALDAVIGIEVVAEMR